MRTVAFCESDPKCRGALAAHWPDVPVYADIRTLRGRLGAVELICGGFPCQPVSSASRGRRKGLQDDRWLWPEMLRLVSEIRPAWVCAENVAHLDGLGLEQVVSDLASIGYESETLEIPACAVGYDHKRTRLWILGHTNRNGEPVVPEHAEVVGMSWRGGLSGSLGATNGLSSRMDRLSQLGNAVIPDIPERLGRAIMRAALNSSARQDTGEG